MTNTRNAKELTLADVQRIFGFQMQFNGSFTPLLNLEPLTEFEQQELSQIVEDYRNYFLESKVGEGLVKALTTFPLLRLAGFYRSPIKIGLEENIAQIQIEDEDTNITGRLDILAVNKSIRTATDTPFWLIVVESKNSLVDPVAGLSQLLTYAYQSLDHQTSVWGLATNGLRYQFVYIRLGDSPTYQIMPDLNLWEIDRTPQILQVLKAICKLQSQ
ncbi:restriction endonuclease subunit R [Aerosakkonemataceae cyanobacterium BLCC-F50]|uniref:Restriction endonuclease subunit R n=1 Tax=Floridaenema flaviceps BLCC-F50 TaxID=3153642 RepID=A0ABV4Y6U0_9CYAN